MIDAALLLDGAARMAASVAGGDRGRGRSADPDALPRFSLEAGGSVRFLQAYRRDGSGAAAGRRPGRAPARSRFRPADAAIRRASSASRRARSAAPRAAGRSRDRACARRRASALDGAGCWKRPGIPTDGLRGAIAVKLTACAYAATLRVWLRDDSPDLASTMAALDRRLRGIERWLGAPRRRGREPAIGPPPARSEPGQFCCTAKLFLT